MGIITGSETDAFAAHLRSLRTTTQEEVDAAADDDAVILWQAERPACPAAH